MNDKKPTSRPTKTQVEMAQIEANKEKFVSSVRLIKHLITVLGAVTAIFLCMTGLENIAKTAPESINALANFVDKLNISNIVLMVTTAGASAGWYRSERGRKRAIKEKSKYQKMVEKDDVYRSSSGLMETGETPEFES